MSTNYKKTKGELIAIYRLEFYKKQKNWKLCYDKKNNTKEQAVKVILNETYNIESGEPHVEPPAPLNDAFLVDESDRNTPPSTDPLTLQSPPAYLNQNLNLPDLKAHEELSAWARADGCITPTEAHYQRSYIEPIQQYNSEWWPGPVECVQPPGTPDPALYEWSPADYGLDPDYCWQPTGKAQPWSVPEAYDLDEGCICCGRQQQFAQEYPLTEGAPCVEAPGEMDAGGLGGVHTVLRTADAWLRTRSMPEWDWEGSCGGDVTADSAGSFLRGAHAAPHSSELELRPLTACSCVVEAGHLAGLSARQLAASLALHARALRSLLRELRARDRLTQHSPYETPPNASVERPTRDAGAAVSAAARPLADPFVAGSFPRAEPPGGRGRGRRLIGIGMGRPYRL